MEGVSHRVHRANLKWFSSSLKWTTVHHPVYRKREAKGLNVTTKVYFLNAASDALHTQLSYAQQQTRSFSGSVVTSSFFCSSWEKLYCRDQTVTGSALSATTSLLLFCRWFVHRKQVSRCMYINLPVGGTKRCIFTHFYVFYVLRKYLIRAQDHFMFLSIFSPKVKSTMMMLKWFLQQFVHLLSVNKAQIVWAVILSLTFNNASVSSNIIFDYCSFLLKQLHNEWIIVRWRNACLLQHVPQLSFTGCKIIVQSTHVSVLRICFTLSSTIHRASLFISEYQSALWFFLFIITSWMRM